MAKISGLKVEEEKTGASLPTILPQHFPAPQAQRGSENLPACEQEASTGRVSPRAEHNCIETILVPGAGCSLQPDLYLALLLTRDMALGMSDSL